MRIKLQHAQGDAGEPAHRYYFEIQADGNHETLAVSEVYRSKQAALAAIKLIEFADNWDVVDET